MINLAKQLCGKDPARYKLHFNDGPFVHNTNSHHALNARFLLDGELEYEARLLPDHWGKANKRYFAAWEIEISDENGALIKTHRFNLAGKLIRINIDSKCLGDTLAWVPQVDRFAKAHPEATVYCSHFWPELGLAETYPDIYFIKPESTLDGIYATYAIGYYIGDEMASMHPVDPRLVPLAKVASDVLGLPYQELRPELPNFGIEMESDKHTVCFTMESTSGCKLWQHPEGWQQVIDYLNANGYQPVLVQKKPDQLQGIINKSGDYPIQKRIKDISSCEFFIGLGSGLSWLAWALGKKVILISGFSEPYTEFEKDCYRVVDNDVCHGCWNDPHYTFDCGDWDWCPRYKGTERQFECSKAITSEQVIRLIQKLVADQKNRD